MTTASRSPLLVPVQPEDDGLRVDRFLALRLPGLSRTRLRSLIESGHVACAGAAIEEPRRRIRPGEVYEVRVPEAEDASPAPEDIPLAIVYEDEDLIVIDKPAGLVVHPAAGHAGGTLVNALLAHCGASLSGIGGVKRPGIVHRLDKDTSGLLVVAKTDAAHQGLTQQFASHGRDGRLVREYRAIVWGVPEPRRGRIEADLARSVSDRTKIAVARGGRGRAAVTHYDVLEAFAGRDRAGVASLLALRLETGRTHQIRVHLAHIHHPLLGDPVYGRGFAASRALLSPAAQAALDDLGRQALHAAILGFEHPVSDARLRFESALPTDMARLLEALAAPPSPAPTRRSARRR